MLSLVSLAPGHGLGAFACGDTAIDDFLRNRALAEQAQGLSAVHVVVDDALDVQAYFTLSTFTIRTDKALLVALSHATKVPYPGVPGYLLGRLGVTKERAGQGMGAALVSRAIDMARQHRDEVGGVFLSVYPKTDKLVVWYERLGFKRIAASSRQMVFSLI